MNAKELIGKTCIREKPVIKERWENTRTNGLFYGGGGYEKNPGDGLYVLRRGCENRRGKRPQYCCRKDFYVFREADPNHIG